MLSLLQNTTLDSPVTLGGAVVVALAAFRMVESLFDKLTGTGKAVVDKNAKTLESLSSSMAIHEVREEAHNKALEKLLERLVSQDEKTTEMLRLLSVEVADIKHTVQGSK